MTIQSLIAQATAANVNVKALVDGLKAMTVLSPAMQDMAVKVGFESDQLIVAAKNIGAEVGAGRFPNTFQTKTSPVKYRVVNSEVEEIQAQKDGLVVATFPQTMTKNGVPDLVVHNQGKKEEAIKNGFVLPELL